MTHEKDDPMTPDTTEPLLLPDVHRTLYAAAVRRRPQGAPHRPARRTPRRTIGIAMTASALVIGGTALAATTPWSPTVGDDRRGHPTTATTDLPGDQLDALAVLRRPQDENDRTPNVQALLELLSADLTGGIRTDSIRVLATREDGTTALYTAERDGFPGVDRPQDVKRDVVCLLFGTHIQFVRGKRVRTPHPTAGVDCGTTSDLRAGKLAMGAQYAGRLELNGLVPDGVSKVSLTLRTGQIIDAPVTNNTFHIDRAAPDGSYEDAPIRWLDDDGREVPQGERSP